MQHGFRSPFAFPALPTPARRTILCVDDDPNVLLTRKMVLENAGYALLTAENSKQALELFGSHNIHLVVSDHLLPGATGSELARRIKQVKPEVPVVLISAVSEWQEKVEHADAFLNKIEGPQRLLEVVNALLATALRLQSAKQSWPRTAIHDHICEFKQGQHVCLVYSSKAEQMTAVVPWIVEGLKREEKCLYLADHNTADEIKTGLAKGGVNVEQECRRGALVFGGKHETYLRGGRFEPQAMLELWQQVTEDSLKSGFSGLRATGEMTWALGPEPGCERLVEYESGLDAFFKKSRALALCQYAWPRFSAPVLKDVLRVHRLGLTKYTSVTDQWSLRIRRKNLWADIFEDKNHPRYQYTIQRQGSPDIIALGAGINLTEAKKTAKAALRALFQ